MGIDFEVIQITLSAHRLLIGSKNETIVEPIAVAHLRGTRNAARLLRDALNKVLSEPEYCGVSQGTASLRHLRHPPEEGQQSLYHAGVVLAPSLLRPPRWRQSEQAE